MDLLELALACEPSNLPHMRVEGSANQAGQKPSSLPLSAVSAGRAVRGQRCRAVTCEQSPMSASCWR